MPVNDKNGEELQPGDVVMVPAVICKTQDHEEFYNLELETLETMYPGDHKTLLLLNSRQVEKPIVVAVATAEFRRAALIVPPIQYGVTQDTAIITGVNDPTPPDPRMHP